MDCGATFERKCRVCLKMMRKLMSFCKGPVFFSGAMFENLGGCSTKCVLKKFSSSSTAGIYAVFMLHGHIISIFLASVNQLEAQVRLKEPLKKLQKPTGKQYPSERFGRFRSNSKPPTFSTQQPLPNHDGVSSYILDLL